MTVPNVNSFLYGRVKRIARLMGYEKVITYTLEEESEASLRAVGARVVSTTKPKEERAGPSKGEPGGLRKGQMQVGALRTELRLKPGIIPNGTHALVHG